MYRNLLAEMERIGISRRDLVPVLNITYTSVLNKINGLTEFTLKEALSIRNHYFPNLTLEYLFERNF